MTERGPKKPKANGGDRVRYEVYGMPVEGIIASALEVDAKEKAAAAAVEAAKAQPDPEPAWPSLEELQGKGRKGSRGGRQR